MKIEDSILLIEEDIRKTNEDLIRLRTIYLKMKIILGEEEIKISLIDSNLEFLRRENVLVSIKEFGVSLKNKKTLRGNIESVKTEMLPVEAALKASETHFENLTNKKIDLLARNGKGILLQFKRTNKNHG